MSSLAQRLLGRLPDHFVAGRPGKRLGLVVDRLAGDLEVLSTELAGVRRAHRVGHAETLTDLFLIAGLHGLGRSEVALLFRRAEGVEAAAAALEAAVEESPEARDAAAARILELWGVEAPELALSLFAPPGLEGEEPDLDAAAARLAAAARRTLTYGALVERTRDRILTTSGIHADGNGTVAALLQGTANALDLDLDLAWNRAEKAALEAAGSASHDILVDDDLFHSRDHFWHASYVRERGPLVREVPAPFPADLVRISGPVSVFELAGFMEEDPMAVLQTARGLGLEVRDVDVLLDFPSARAVAADHGFVVEWATRSRLRVQGPVLPAALARAAGVPLQEMLERLEAVGAVDPDAATAVAPPTAARALRFWGVAVDEVLRDPTDVVGLEENPLRRFTYEDQDAPHGHRFTILRKGFGRTLMRAEMEGLQDADGEHELTVGPMLVNRDEGHGIGFFGTVPAGQVLDFQEEGRVFLDGDDVTDRAYSWKGACFADAGSRHDNDFVFRDLTTEDDRWARFAVATPEGALDRDATFPHAGGAVEMPGVAVGATRMGFFVQVNRLSSREGTPEAPVVRRATPHPFIGFADQSVFAVPTSPGGPLPPPGYPVAARVAVSWLEHEAYAARILIPARFQGLEDGEVPLADRLLTALERFRPAGVDLRVAYIDDQWTLGEGTLGTEAGGDPLALIKGGTVLWPSPSEDD